MAIVFAEGARSRLYLSPTTDHETTAARAEPAWEPEGELPDDPRNFWITLYGLKTFASLFTPRQLVSLTTFSDLVAEAREKLLVDSSACALSDDDRRLHAGGVGQIAYADAIATYLALVVDRMAFYIPLWMAPEGQRDVRRHPPHQHEQPGARSLRHLHGHGGEPDL
jgi:putative DNA methylase